MINRMKVTVLGAERLPGLVVRVDDAGNVIVDAGSVPLPSTARPGPVLASPILKKSNRGGWRPGAGRKPPDPALVARVLALAAEGLIPRQIIEHPDVKGRRSLRAVYLDIERQRGAVAETKAAP
jgi:hypothetical protein